MRILASVLFLLPLLCSQTQAAPATPARIAFVDTGNTGRSLMAEALANAMIHQQGLHIQVISRALDRNPYNVDPEPNATTLLKQAGIDVSGHLAVQLTPQDVRHSDLILTATEKHKAGVTAIYPEAAAKIFTFSEYATGQAVDIVDAFGQPMSVYEQVFGQINGYLPAILAKAVKN
jgi:protein-tyrosine phosphatase